MSTAVTGAEMEVERAWDDRTLFVERRKSSSDLAVAVVVVDKGDGD